MFYRPARKNNKYSRTSSSASAKKGDFKQKLVSVRPFGINYCFNENFEHQFVLMRTGQFLKGRSSQILFRMDKTGDWFVGSLTSASLVTLLATSAEQVSSSDRFCSAANALSLQPTD